MVTILGLVITITAAVFAGMGKFLVAGLILLMTAKTPSQGRHRGIITVVALGLAAVAIISGRYFFPLPAIFTGLAAIFSLVSAKVAE